MAWGPASFWGAGSLRESTAQESSHLFLPRVQGNREEEEKREEQKYRHRLGASIGGQSVTEQAQGSGDNGRSWEPWKRGTDSRIWDVSAGS